MHYEAISHIRLLPHIINSKQYEIDFTIRSFWFLTLRQDGSAGVPAVPATILMSDVGTMQLLHHHLAHGAVVGIHTKKIHLDIYVYKSNLILPDCSYQNSVCFLLCILLKEF